MAELDRQSLIDQIDRALAAWEEAKTRSQYHDLSDLGAEGSKILTLMATTMDRIAPRESQYRHIHQDAVADYANNTGENWTVLAGVLMALRSDLDAGYMQSVEESIHASVFDDFLEMADHLLSEGYKDPAAVLAGGVLEGHLRKLAGKNQIPTHSGNRPKKADTVNAELAKASAYSQLDQKNVTAWLDLRNKAAHGHYGDYTSEQVALTIQAVRDFISRNPA